MPCCRRSRERPSIRKGHVSQDTNIFSADPANAAARTASAPLIFLFQVVEADPDGPTRDDVLGVLKGGLSTAVSLFEENYVQAATTGIPWLVDTFELFMGIAGGGDDRYPVIASAYNEQRLVALTTGSSPGPLE